MTSQKKPLLNEILQYKSIAAIIFKRGTQNNEQTANNWEITWSSEFKRLIKNIKFTF